MAAGKPNKSHHKKPHLHHETWKELFEDDEHGGLLIPILALAYEHDLDPEMRPCKDAIDPAHREKLTGSKEAECESAKL